CRPLRYPLRCTWFQANRPNGSSFRPEVSGMDGSVAGRYDNRAFGLFMGAKEMLEVKQSRALATRERILRTAAGLFAVKGFHDTKLKDVLCSAKVTTGAFFHHFQN